MLLRRAINASLGDVCRIAIIEVLNTAASLGLTFLRNPPCGIRKFLIDFAPLQVLVYGI